jgi:hypothetical protein
MFARNVSLRLKANQSIQFANLFETEGIALVRRPPGCRDAVVLGSEGDMQVTAISLWDTKIQADAYNASGFPSVLRILEPVLNGVPKVRIANVITSTLIEKKPVAVPA